MSRSVVLILIVPSSFQVAHPASGPVVVGTATDRWSKPY